MDLSTVLGVALAWLFVGTAIYLGADGKAAALIDPPPLVVLGMHAATMAASFSDLKRLPKVLMKTVFWKWLMCNKSLIKPSSSTPSRKGGVKDVEEACKRPEMYPFLRVCGVRCQRAESSTVEAQLNRRLDAITIRHETENQWWSPWPEFGSLA